jgi:hypothetical protein
VSFTVVPPASAAAPIQEAYIAATLADDAFTVGGAAVYGGYAVGNNAWVYFGGILPADLTTILSLEVQVYSALVGAGSRRMDFDIGATPPATTSAGEVRVNDTTSSYTFPASEINFWIDILSVIGAGNVGADYRLGVTMINRSGSNMYLPDNGIRLRYQ